MSHMGGLNKAKISGVYVLYDGETPIYIGQSKNIYSRIANHFYGTNPPNNPNKGSFDSWDYIECDDPRQRKILEGVLLRLLSPRNNTPMMWSSALSLEESEIVQKFAPKVRENPSAIWDLLNNKQLFPNGSELPTSWDFKRSLCHAESFAESRPGGS